MNPQILQTRHKCSHLENKYDIWANYSEEHLLNLYSKFAIFYEDVEN